MQSRVLKSKLLRNFFVKKVSQEIQVFPEVCRYSCSRHGEIREFSLYRQYYHVKLLWYETKALESIKVVCQNCRWSSELPGGFAKKAFKDGLQSNFLIEYSKSRIITSKILNVYGSLWRVWIFTLGVVMSITLIRLYFEPVEIIAPKEISLSEVKDPSHKGEIIKVSGKVDYTLTLLREVKTGENEKQTVDNEVYLPLFAKNGGDEFIVIKGGKEDVENVLSRSNIINYEFLKNQDYTITGRLESVNDIKNQNIKKFFTEELPQKRNLRVPELVINSADAITLPQFYNQVAPYYYVFVFLLVSSTAIQFYKDKVLVGQ